MTALYLAATRLKELTLSLRVSALDVALWLAVTVLLLMGVNVAAQIAEKVIETTAEMVETSVSSLNAERPPEGRPRDGLADKGVLRPHQHLALLPLSSPVELKDKRIF